MKIISTKRFVPTKISVAEIPDQPGPSILWYPTVSEQDSDLSGAWLCGSRRDTVCSGNTPPKRPYTAHESRTRAEQGFTRPYGKPTGDGADRKNPWELPVRSTPARRTEEASTPSVRPLWCLPLTSFSDSLDLRQRMDFGDSFGEATPGLTRLRQYPSMELATISL